MDELFEDPEARPKRSLSRLETDDGSTVLYTLTEYEGGDVAITASDGTKTWVGRVSARQLREMASRVKMGEEEFVEETLKALTRENMGRLNFVYTSQVTPSGGLELVWKKHLIAENIKFQLGVATLDPQASVRVHSCLLGHAIDSITSLREQISDLQTERTRLVGERQAALGQLEKCASLKEDIENDLYSKFKLVLNEKKGKIRRLMDQLSSLSEQNKTLQSEVKAGDRTMESVERDNEEEVPSDQSGDETDDNMPSDHSHTPSPRPKGRPPPSLLGDDVETISPPVKRRRRQGARKAPGQPEIPRPPSITRPTSHGKVKMRSTSGDGEGEGGRGRSEESIESDELLNLL